MPSSRVSSDALIAGKGFTGPLSILSEQIIHCDACPRLVTYREEIGRIKRRAYREENYWSRPVPGFGDPSARLWIVGLAPGAHGANRTGRVFTGDRSGDFLYRALWETGFANQSQSLSISDGLILKDAYISAAVRCAPPDNKPERDEILTCRPYLAREFAFLGNLQVVVALGGLAFAAYLAVLQQNGVIQRGSSYSFGHAAAYLTHDGGPALLASYHPSQQNTSTKRLTAEMLRDIFLRVRSMLRDPARQAEGPE